MNIYNVCIYMYVYKCVYRERQRRGREIESHKLNYN